MRVNTCSSAVVGDFPELHFIKCVFLQHRSFKRVITSSICGINTHPMFQTPSSNRIYLPANGLIGLCNTLPCVSSRYNSITRPNAVGFNKAIVVMPALNTYHICNGSQKGFVHSYQDADKSLAGPGRTETSYSDQTLTFANHSKKFRILSVKPGLLVCMTSASDEKWRPFNCFF